MPPLKQIGISYRIQKMPPPGFEIKSGMTFSQDWPAAAKRWTSYAGAEALEPWIIYGGARTFDLTDCRAFSWRALLENPNA